MLAHDEGDVVAAGRPAFVQEGELPLGRGQAPEAGRPQAQPAVAVAGVPGHERALQALLGGQWGHGVGGRLDPEEAVPARFGEVDERPPVGRRPGRRERQPVGAVGVLEGPPGGRDGRPRGAGRGAPLAVVAAEALPDDGAGQGHGHGGQHQREPHPAAGGAEPDRLPGQGHRRDRGQPPPAPAAGRAREPPARATGRGPRGGGVLALAAPAPVASRAVPEPDPPDGGAPAREGSPAGAGAAPVVHTPPLTLPAATWRSRGRTWAGVARAAGSLTSRRARTGARGPRRRAWRGRPLTIALRVWNSPPPKGGWPSTANHRVAPRAHRSVAGLTGSASTCSGAM